MHLFKVNNLYITKELPQPQQQGHGQDQPKAKPEEKVEHKKVTNEEEALLQQLEKIHNKLDINITPQVKTYEKDVKGFLSHRSKTEKEKKKQIYMGAYLGEQLMHILFDLDGFICGPGNLNARQTRKDAVKSAQGLLDKVDEIKSVVKNVKVDDST